MESAPEYAGVRIRFLAVVADLAILAVPFLAVTRIVKGTWIMSSGDHDWVSGWFVTDPLCLSFLAVMFLYFVLFEGLWGATLGKRVVGLRVVGVHGPAGLRRSLVRNVLRVVDNLPALGIVAVVLISRSEERARFGDRVAGTRVLRTRGGAAGSKQCSSTGG